MLIIPDTKTLDFKRNDDADLWFLTMDNQDVIPLLLTENRKTFTEKILRAGEPFRSLSGRIWLKTDDRIWNKTDAPKTKELWIFASSSLKIWRGFPEQNYMAYHTENPDWLAIHVSSKKTKMSLSFIDKEGNIYTVNPEEPSYKKQSAWEYDLTLTESFDSQGTHDPHRPIAPRYNQEKKRYNWNPEHWGRIKIESDRELDPEPISETNRPIDKSNWNELWKGHKGPSANNKKTENQLPNIFPTKSETPKIHNQETVESVLFD